MTIVLVVGPSGSGKDTLLRAARMHCRDNGRIRFVRRYINRPPDEREDNYFISKEGFTVLQRAGFFQSYWEAHGYMYGIARSDCYTGKRPGVVVISVSRSAIAAFEACFCSVVTVQIWAEREVLKDRLQQRGRESGADVERRLLRASLPVQARDLITFDNSGHREAAQLKFVGLLDRVAADRSKPVVWSTR